MSSSTSNSVNEKPATAFPKLPALFPNLVDNTNEKIKTQEFLEASAAAATLLEKFAN